MQYLIIYFITVYNYSKIITRQELKRSQAFKDAKK